MTNAAGIVLCGKLSVHVTSDTALCSNTCAQTRTHIQPERDADVQTHRHRHVFPRNNNLMLLGSCESWLNLADVYLPIDRRDVGVCAWLSLVY